MIFPFPRSGEWEGPIAKQWEGEVCNNHTLSPTPATQLAQPIAFAIGPFGFTREECVNGLPSPPSRAEREWVKRIRESYTGRYRPGP
jgi:hypothetical protein